MNDVGVRLMACGGVAAVPVPLDTNGGFWRRRRPLTLLFDGERADYRPRTLMNVFDPLSERRVDVLVPARLGSEGVCVISGFRCIDGVVEAN